MSLFYRPFLAVAGDVIPFFDDGVYKPFYLRNFRSRRDANHRDGWVMLTTRDHLRFEETDTGIAGGTGSVFKLDGVYHMFYCVFQQLPERNLICHAISRDLKSWRTLEDETFGSDDAIYGFCHWRDPFVFWNETEKRWWMLIAATMRGPTARQACVGLCKSDDLKRWTYEAPLYAPMNAAGAFECPDLFRWGDWWYLVFSCYADRFCTLYRMARTLDGPWLKPEVDTFDTRCFYAAKTVWDGARRLIYGWNPTREADEHGFDPQSYDGRDANSWDWGGNLIVNELWQRDDGTLAVRPLREVCDAVSRPAPLDIQPLTGEWQCVGDGVSVSAPHSYGAALLGKLPDRFRAEIDFSFSEGTKRLGFAFQVDGDFAAGYYLEIEPDRRRVQFKSPVRMTEPGGQRFSYEIELERPLALRPDEINHLTVLGDGDVLECYFNGDTALGARMCDIRGKALGVYAEQSEARFSDVRIFA